METNAMLFAVIHEQRTLDGLERAGVAAGLAWAQRACFQRLLAQTSAQRIERLAAAFRGEAVDYGPFADMRAT